MTMLHRIFGPLLFLLALPAAGQQLHPETGERLAEDQSFAFSLPAQVPTFDPHLVQDVVASQVSNQIFEALLRLAEDGSAAPGVAERWTSTDDTVWTFHLREDARWSNGDPVTAQDFVYAWRRSADPKTASPYAWFMETAAIENAGVIIAGERPPEELGIEAVDHRTLRVTLDRPVSYLPTLLTYPTFKPVHRPTVDAHGADWTAPSTFVGNGPFVLDDSAIGERFRLLPNPHFHSAAEVIIDEVVGHIIPDRSQALLRWEAGEFDMMDMLPAGRFPELKAEYPEAAHSAPRLCSYYIETSFVEGQANDSLLDARVRRAMSLAIDRDVIVERFLRGGETPAYTLTHVNTTGFEPPEISEASLSPGERMEKATALMAEAGHGPDRPLDVTLIYPEFDSIRDVLTIIQQMWRPLGIEVSLENYEWKAYLEILQTGKFELAGGGWCADYDEPSTFLDLLGTESGWNNGQYSNLEIDRLLQEARFAADKAPLYAQIELILAEERSLIPLWHDVKTFLLDTSIRGWPIQNNQDVWYLDQIYRVAEPPG